MSRSQRDWTRLTPTARIALAAAAHTGVTKSGAHWAYRHRGRTRLFGAEIITLLLRHDLVEIRGGRAIAKGTVH